MIDYEEIRKEVAVKHGVLLDSGDPLLVSVTINETLLRGYVEILNTQNEAHQRAFSLALTQAVEESKEVGEKIVTQGARYLSEHTCEDIEKALKEAKAEIRKDVDCKKEANHSRDRALKERGFFYGVIFASAITMGIATILKVFF